MAASCQAAGPSYTTSGDVNNEPYAINSDDLLATHMLSVDIAPPVVRELLQNGTKRQRVSELLSQISPNVRLWEDDAVSSLVAAEELWDALNEISGIGWVVAGKILARKRPHLIPIADDRVWEYFKPEKGLFWETLRGVLRQDGLSAQIEADLRIPMLQTSEMRDKISTLRLLDIAIWMKG